MGCSLIPASALTSQLPFSCWLTTHQPLWLLPVPSQSGQRGFLLQCSLQPLAWSVCCPYLFMLTPSHHSSIFFWHYIWILSPELPHTSLFEKLPVAFIDFICEMHFFKANVYWVFGMCQALGYFSQPILMMTDQFSEQITRLSSVCNTPIMLADIRNIDVSNC